MGCVSSKGDQTIKVDQPQTGAAEPVKSDDIKLESQASSGSTGAKDTKRRVGVSAEASAGGAGEYKKVVHAKSDEAT